jgi:uncharacterized membrane protein YphA (DoxX/SURF4 family)
LHAGLWVAQILVAVAFGAAGAMKATQPIPELVQQMGWPGALPPPLVRFIGAAELLGAIGVILPAVTRVRPWLTPLAAASLALVMLLAAAFHTTRGEVEGVLTNLVLGSVAAFVAWGRARKAPIVAHPGGTY